MQAICSHHSDEMKLIASQVLPFRLVPVQRFAGTTRDASQVQVTRRNQEKLTMSMLMKRLLKDESGATAIEYGLIAAGISVAIIAVVQGLGSKLNSTFTSVQNALN